MAKSSKVWQKWDVQKHRIREVDALFIDPVKYAAIGKDFTEEQFLKVEAALNAPAEHALLDKMREAVCVYLSMDTERRAQLMGGLAGHMSYLRPKGKRKKFVDGLIKNIEEFSDFLDRNRFHIGSLSSFEQIDSLHKVVSELPAIMRRKYWILSADIKPGSKNAQWHVFLCAIALIYETVHGKRPTIPHNRITNKPYGPFLDFARASLRLIGQHVEDDTIDKAFKNKYQKRNDIIMQDRRFDYFRAG